MAKYAIGGTRVYNNRKVIVKSKVKKWPSLGDMIVGWQGERLAMVEREGGGGQCYRTLRRN